MATNGPGNSFAQPKHEDILIEYVKEKESLRGDLKEKDQEIQKLKSKVYDLTQKLEELQKKNKTKNKENLTEHNKTSLDSPHLTAIRPHTGKARTPVMKRAKSAKRRKARAVTKTTNGESDRVLRADMMKYNDVPEVIEHYVEVSNKFPDLKLSVLLEAEKLFYESDINNDGAIDEEEMEKMLMRQGYLFTNAELKNIMTSIDVDNSNSVELLEYLSILEKIQQRKRVDLPQQLTKSSLCLIQ